MGSDRFVDLRTWALAGPLHVYGQQATNSRFSASLAISEGPSTEINSAEAVFCESVYCNPES